MGRPRAFDLDATLKTLVLLFWRKGYDATSLADIEAATGLGRMSLYNIFGGKEGLFRSVLERYLDATRRLYDKLLPTGGLAELEALIEAHVRPDRLGEAGGWGCLMLNSIAASGGISDDVAAMVEAFRCEAVGRIERALARAKALGEIDDGLDLHQLADFILTALWGAKLAIRHSRSPAAVDSTAHILPIILRRTRQNTSSERR